LVGKFLTAPDSLLVMVMLTFGTAAPEGSVTVPTMVACCARAASEKTARTTQPSNAVRRGNLLLTERDNLEFDVELIDLTPHPRDFGSATVTVHSEVFQWSAAIPTLRKSHMTTQASASRKYRYCCARPWSALTGGVPALLAPFW
jgi:hypothetical protein